MPDFDYEKQHRNYYRKLSAAKAWLRQRRALWRRSRPVAKKHRIGCLMPASVLAEAKAANKEKQAG